MSAPGSPSPQAKARTPSRRRGRSTGPRSISRGAESDAYTDAESSSGGRRRNRKRGGKKGGGLPAVDEVPQPAQDVANTAKGAIGGVGGGQEAPAPAPAAEEKEESSGAGALSLRLDLNLDIWIELKAKIHGDVTLALL
ncbi:hypothetical protein PLICRDRAFT_53342 [Plicaturopsis crispa FD-325 SS-3]|nr:hypothetical protein PLICRDRAFT_53342 [Plicaturopsis crispa FD-325 SS-3]